MYLQYLDIIFFFVANFRNELNCSDLPQDLMVNGEMSTRKVRLLVRLQTKILLFNCNHLKSIISCKTVKRPFEKKEHIMLQGLASVSTSVHKLFHLRLAPTVYVQSS